MKLPTALALMLCLSLPAAAATRLEATREKATAARAVVQDVRARQMAQRKELNEVAARIEALKAERKGALTPGGELDGALKRSQELSGSLTSLAQSMAQAESDAQRENLALLEALSQELTRLRGEFDRQTD